MNLSGKSLVYIIAGSLVTLVSVHQGCSGMKSAEYSSLGEQGAADTDTPAQIDGKALYAQNCAGCHQPLSQSTKLGRTAMQISNAIASVSSMSGMSWLSAEQKNAIASVLKVPVLQAKFQCVDPGSRGLAENRMLRLTKPQLANTLVDLFGSTLINDSQIKAHLENIPNDLLGSSPNDIPASHATTHAKAMFNIAHRLAELSFTDTNARNLIYGLCAGQSTVSSACAQSFIENFGLRVYRRPLDSSETASMMAQYNKASGVEGLKRVMMRFIMSAPLAFHLEINGVASGAKVRLSDYEVASRLSYRLIGTMPDAILLDAAKNGQLQSVANVKEQAQRLLSSTNHGKNQVNSFFRYYLDMDRIPEPYPGAVKLNGLTTGAMAAELQQETTDFINYVFWSPTGRLVDLFTSKKVFPRTTNMAKILETTIATGSTPVETTEDHAGLILRPGMLAHSDKLTKPFHRAALIRKRILCEKFGSPDAAQVEDRIGELGDLSDMGNRDRLDLMTKTNACMTCHSRVNPVAFALEGYDQVGMRRSVETVYDGSNNPKPKTYAINTLVQDVYLDDATGPVYSIANARELVSTIASGQAAKSCFAQMVFEYQRAREIQQSDNCALSEVEKATSNTGTAFDAYVTAVANEDIFWKAK